MLVKSHDNFTLYLRRRELWKIARSEGLVQVNQLIEEFNFTFQTISRNWNRLYGTGLLQRIHGGSINSDSVVKLSCGVRKTPTVEGKLRTAQKTAQLTHRHEGLLFVTNNLNVLNILVRLDQGVLSPVGRLDAMIQHARTAMMVAYGSRFQHNAPDLLCESDKRTISSLMQRFQRVSCWPQRFTPQRFMHGSNRTAVAGDFALMSQY